MEIVTQLLQAHPVTFEVLAVIGVIDLALGVISKHTPFKWDDNLYSMLHGLLTAMRPK